MKHTQGNPRSQALPLFACVDKDGTAATTGADRLEETIATIKERRARVEEHRPELETSGEDQISLTDPDARAMHSLSRVGVGYNIQIAADTKHKLIAEQQVHNNVNGLGLRRIETRMWCQKRI